MIKRKTRVLFIHHGTGIGGAPISLLNLVKSLDDSKFDVSVAFVKGGVAVELFNNAGVKTEVIGSSNLWFAHNESAKIGWRYFYRYFSVYRHWLKTAHSVGPRYFEKHDCDIVHLNSHVLTSWAYAAKSVGKKVVIHNREAISRGYFGIRYKVLKRLIYANCDAIINISFDNQRRLGIQEKSSVVYNFVEIPRHYRLSMSGKMKDRRKVLFLGGMARIKGFELVTRCLPYLRSDVTVQIAGSLGTLVKGQGLKERLIYWIKLNVYGRLYRPLQKIQQASNVEILGVLQDPLIAINDCDILITPFQVPHFSRPAIEAFAYGKPVIGSNVEGMDEIIDNGVNGYLVEKNNPKSLADAINYLCANPEVAREMGRNGREKAARLFSPSRNTKQVESIYDELIKTRRTS